MYHIKLYCIVLYLVLPSPVSIKWNKKQPPDILRQNTNKNKENNNQKKSMKTKTFLLFIKKRIRLFKLKFYDLE